MSEPKIVFPSLDDSAPTAAPAKPVLANAPPAKSGQPAKLQVEPKVVFPEVSMDEKIRAGYRTAAQGDLARLRGLTFGLSDRALALIKSGSYEDNLKGIQADRDQYAAENPMSSIGNEILGGLASGGAVSGAVRKVASKVLPGLAEFAKGIGAAPAALRVAAPVAESAAYGELSHQAQRPYGKVGTEVGTGALYGAAGGAAGMAAAGGAKAVMKAGGKIGQRVALAAGLAKPEDFAAKKFKQTLSDRGTTLEDVAETMKHMRGDDLQIQGPSLPGENLPDLRTPVRVADAVPLNTLNMLKKAIGASDRAKADVSEAMSNRNAEQVTRMQNHVTGTISDDVDSTAAKEALEAARAKAAGPHYEQAYAVGDVKDPIVDKWIKDRPVNSKLFFELKNSLDQNASAGMGEGRRMKADLTSYPDGTMEWKQRPTIEDLDTLKKHVDSKINDLWNPTKDQFNAPKRLGDSDAKQLMNQRDDLVKMIDSLTPDGNGGSHYANARKAFADDSQLLDAHREGRMVIRHRPEDIAKQFDKLAGSPEKQEQFRAGAVAVINDMLEKADTKGGAAAIRKLYGSKQMQKKIEYIMANPSSSETFSRNMNAEKAFIDTQKNLVPSSGGDNLLDSAEGFALPLAAANALAGRFGSAANHLGRFGMGAMGGVAPEVGDDLGRIALMNPEEYGAWVKMMRAKENTVGARIGRGVDAVGRYAGRSLPSSLAVQGGLMSGAQPDEPQMEDF